MDILVAKNEERVQLHQRTNKITTQFFSLFRNKKRDKSCIPNQKKECIVFKKNIRINLHKINNHFYNILRAIFNHIGLYSDYFC